MASQPALNAAAAAAAAPINLAPGFAHIGFNALPPDQAALYRARSTVDDAPSRDDAPSLEDHHDERSHRRRRRRSLRRRHRHWMRTAVRSLFTAPSIAAGVAVVVGNVGVRVATVATTLVTRAGKLAQAVAQLDWIRGESDESVVLAAAAQDEADAAEIAILEAMLQPRLALITQLYRLAERSVWRTTMHDRVQYTDRADVVPILHPSSVVPLPAILHRAFPALRFYGKAFALLELQSEKFAASEQPFHLSPALDVDVDQYTLHHYPIEMVRATFAQPPLIRFAHDSLDAASVSQRVLGGEAASSVATDVTCLPDEILLHIFQFLLPSVADLRRIAAVCRAWKRVSEDPSIWRVVVLNKWPIFRAPSLHATFESHVALYNNNVKSMWADGIQKACRATAHFEIYAPYNRDAPRTVQSQLRHTRSSGWNIQLCQQAAADNESVKVVVTPTLSPEVAWIRPIKLIITISRPDAPKVQEWRYASFASPGHPSRDFWMALPVPEQSGSGSTSTLPRPVQVDVTLVDEGMAEPFTSDTTLNWAARSSPTYRCAVVTDEDIERHCGFGLFDAIILPCYELAGDDTLSALCSVIAHRHAISREEQELWLCFPDSGSQELLFHPRMLLSPHHIQTCVIQDLATLCGTQSHSYVMHTNVTGLRHHLIAQLQTRSLWTPASPSSANAHTFDFVVYFRRSQPAEELARAASARSTFARFSAGLVAERSDGDDDDNFEAAMGLFNRAEQSLSVDASSLVFARYFDRELQKLWNLGSMLVSTHGTRIDTLKQFVRERAGLAADADLVMYTTSSSDPSRTESVLEGAVYLRELDLTSGDVLYFEQSASELHLATPTRLRRLPRPPPARRVGKAIFDSSLPLFSQQLLDSRSSESDLLPNPAVLSLARDFYLDTTSHPAILVKRLPRVNSVSEFLACRARIVQVDLQLPEDPFNDHPLLVSLCCDSNVLLYQLVGVAAELLAISPERISLCHDRGQPCSSFMSVRGVSDCSRAAPLQRRFWCQRTRQPRRVYSSHDGVAIFVVVDPNHDATTEGLGTKTIRTWYDVRRERKRAFESTRRQRAQASSFSNTLATDPFGGVFAEPMYSKLSGPTVEDVDFTGTILDT
ncbi:hypothetical protein CAOG_04677 [Capsaspora owczarzaki ATCC 30864]|uniref:F-box domain-containing protein n=1 Tax=Capsaspora owczarzaki (strain ATCC 30864) TaxID=595528 RepID=A0A0D2WRP1_CAPO3|nr:hypothetical protein CAOG_04677 [Capsaspora owczarzaki ATCC 30864]KJE93968.1 hypothetical protein CAOG_004677 [Capsaspora owczarzaki ATCC 30864]|eukprot:XP_004347424.1 hypothetical protein CAOG_04677 [Capsaspora owczarzaki ATCC 30864]